MRYKKYTIEADVRSYEKYGVNRDLPELVNIYVDLDDIGSKPKPGEFVFERQITVAEDHPNFNFDLWANIIDRLDQHNGEAERDFGPGTQRLNNFILEHFPIIHEYYKDYDL